MGTRKCSMRQRQHCDIDHITFRNCLLTYINMGLAQCTQNASNNEQGQLCAFYFNYDLPIFDFFFFSICTCLAAIGKPASQFSWQLFSQSEKYCDQHYYLWLLQNMLSSLQTWSSHIYNGGKCTHLCALSSEYVHRKYTLDAFNKNKIQSPLHIVWNI